MTDPAPAGRPLRYAGYRSYPYLERGRDYRAFDLAAEVDRVPSHVVAVSDAEEARTWRILATHPAISLHDHL
jgi:membrane dipeptidase